MSGLGLNNDDKFIAAMVCLCLAANVVLFAAEPIVEAMYNKHLENLPKRPCGINGKQSTLPACQTAPEIK